MVEMRFIPGRCKCQKKLDMRIMDVKDERNDIIAWIIYGNCRSCKISWICEMFIQTEEPMNNTDYMIDYDETIKADRGEKIV